MVDYSDCAFSEDAVSAEEALGASARFAAYRSGGGLAFRLVNDGDLDARLISRDEVMHFLERRLEAGGQVEMS